MAEERDWDRELRDVTGDPNAKWFAEDVDELGWGALWSEAIVHSNELAAHVGRWRHTRSTFARVAALVDARNLKSPNAPDGEPADAVLESVRRFATAREAKRPNVRIIGNVRACDIQRAIEEQRAELERLRRAETELVRLRGILWMRDEEL